MKYTIIMSHFRLYTQKVLCLVKMQQQSRSENINAKYLLVTGPAAGAYSALRPYNLTLSLSFNHLYIVCDLQCNPIQSGFLPAIMEVPLAEFKPYFQQAVPPESGNYHPMSYCM